MSDDGFKAAALKAVPSVEQIERLLEGNCHHGMAVALCPTCSHDRLFEAMMVNLAPHLDINEEDARAAAVQMAVESRNPTCCHAGCARLAEFTGQMRFNLRGAGEATGTYEGEFDSALGKGGVCSEHRESFRVEVAGRDIAANVCAAQGVELPAAATWDFAVDWKPIQKEAV